MVDKKIVIDARMINNSGIGRYLKEIIDQFCLKYKYICLYGDKALLKKNYKHYTHVFYIQSNIKIYSLSEIFILPLQIPFCDLFISPHYNVPIFLPQAKKRMVVIADVNHLVFSSNLSSFKKIYANFFLNWSINHSNYIFTISEFSKAEIIKYLNCSPDKINVAKLGIDQSYFSSVLESQCSVVENESIKYYENISYVLFVGNLKPHKNLKRSLLAFSKIKVNFPEYKFVIVGKKDKLLNIDFDIFEILNNDIMLKNDIILTGEISENLLAHIYNNAKCLLFVSLYEGFGFPPLEAMFYNCPVLSSSEGSLPEICGNAALYCDAYSIDDISLKLANILEDKNLRLSLISNGKTRVDLFNWISFKESILNIVSDL